MSIISTKQRHPEFFWEILLSKTCFRCELFISFCENMKFVLSGIILVCAHLTVVGGESNGAESRPTEYQVLGDSLRSEPTLTLSVRFSCWEWLWQEGQVANTNWVVKSWTKCQQAKIWLPDTYFYIEHRSQIKENLLIIGPAGNILWDQRMTVVFTQVSLGSGQFNIGDKLPF